MNNKFVFAVVGVVVGVVAGYFLFTSSGGLQGASITASNALNQQRLINEFTAIANPLTGWLTTSSVINGVALGSVGATTSTASTTFTLTGAFVGDYLEYGVVSPTAGVAVTCFVSATSTVNCAQQNLTSSQTEATATVYVEDLPRATFISPTGL